MRQRVQLHGGPRDGHWHDLKDPFGMGVEPEKIGVPLNDAFTVRAWYKIAEDGEYHYERTQEDFPAKMGTPVPDAGVH
jgi:hypothetical protein